MEDFLKKIRLILPYCTVLPLLVLVFITGPKVFGGLKALGYFGGSEPVTGILESKYQREENSSHLAGCGIKIRVNGRVHKHGVQCDDEWLSHYSGERLSLYEVWGMYFKPSEIRGHLILDAALMVIELCFIAFFLLSDRFIDRVNNGSGFNL